MSAVFFLLSLAFIPFTSALVRYRIAYYPKESPTSPSLPIDDTNVENGGPTDELAPTSSGKVIAEVEGSSPAVESAPSLLSVLKRVRRLEGWGGFYKGILPTFLVNIFTPFFIMYNGVPRLLTLIYVYRAIATPRKLEIFGTSIKDAMRTLFTDHERRRPWVLWLTPGLLPALLFNILLRILVLRPVRNLIAGDLKRMSATGDALRMTLTAVFLLLSTVVLAPLDVVVTRLAVQRNNGGPKAEAESLASEGVYDAAGEQFNLEKSNSLPVPVSADREPVVEDVVVKVRGEKNPYLGLYDCAKKIVQEEGWATLYRGWWVTFLSATVSI
ncbi:hypothetical protein Hypma_006639 [Hypsizygus marmoreus]|uniref:Mitochondrial carrier n=1 Tax=Hypsizygus marmoreus TaxID=39966 RepID=A0A369K5Z6_HYPMA|nr:hypothetical protein Hypma_006639 [Hypsizygus marmoreus]